IPSAADAMRQLPAGPAGPGKRRRRRGDGRPPAGGVTGAPAAAGYVFFSRTLGFSSDVMTLVFCVWSRSTFVVWPLISICSSPLSWRFISELAMRPLSLSKRMVPPALVLLRSALLMRNGSVLPAAGSVGGEYFSVVSTLIRSSFLAASSLPSAFLPS